ncbi:GlsB/YeaQ/YmgE family stress response membrane protein [Halotalea alkalilenta]|uniref:GlsB/YeaQ/YmgE family stress response membrane protein n=1 Tax=Halotalea alkalilenta TaxID=376489 RepID=UPI0005BBF336|nr:hypothetical protein [Halotalea alkalilenta]
MDIISWIITGAVIGALANLAISSRFSIGYLGAMGVGALGAVMASFIASIFAILPELQFSVTGLVTSVIGSLIAQIAVVAYRKVARV